MADLNQIGTEVVALGRLAGVLGGTGTDVTFQGQWFENPATSLRTAGTRLGELALVADKALGPAIPGSPSVFTGAAWYTVPNPASGTGSPLKLVMPPPESAAGEIGIGVAEPRSLGHLAIDAFAYLPLLRYDTTRAHLVVGDQDAPLQIGLAASSTDPEFRFTSDLVSYSGVTAKGSIVLGDHPPAFEIDFADLQGTDQQGPFHHLDDLVKEPVIDWLAALVAGCTPWLEIAVGNAPPLEPGDQIVTVGKVLEKAGFLLEDDKGNYSVTLAKLKGSDPKQIALNFVFALADGLAGADVPLVPLPGGGIYVAHNEKTGDYGVRAAATVSIEPEQKTEGKAPPEIEVSLGSWFSNETAPNTWMQHITGEPVDPGLTVMLLNRQGETIKFAPGFALLSAGLNVRGGAGAPLIDVSGFTLNGVEGRASIDDKLGFGLALRLDGIGFPVGPELDKAEASGSNPMASSLLAKGGSSDAPASPVNPAFSAEVGYIRDKRPLFEVLDPKGAPTDLIWIPIQRRFGPLSCKRIGAKLDGEDLTVLFDGGVKLGGLDIELTELSVGVDLSAPTDASKYHFDLKGLDVTFAAGSVEVSGGLLKRVDGDGNLSYDGEALIKTPEITLSAIGSFASLKGGGTSLFVFASLSAPIGGPPFLFVTGLSAGFGYNRSLKIPTQDEVAGFPLLAGLSSPDAPSPHDALESLQKWVEVERGEYWLAAGIQFTSFEIINTSALLVVEFGHELVIALIGISTVRQPLAGDAYVYAEIDLEVVFRPDAGSLSASAVLAPSSYVLTRDAHLTGGFAFDTWFGGHDHSGDFVFTIGGYHPAFDVPKHYPKEPRLGINWAVTSGINVLGEAYFALTPAAGMAGGKLALTLDEDPLHAWLKVQVDALVRWNPFFFDAAASISIGVSFRLDIGAVTVTLSVELGADLELWGPPVGFRVHVDWYVVSFTIEHGDKAPQKPLEWDGFKAMLPSKDVKQAEHQNRAPLRAMVEGAAPTAPATAAATDAKQPQWLHITAVDGLSTDKTVAGLDHWLMRAPQFEVRVGSAVPSTTITVENGGPGGDLVLSGKPVAIRPLGIKPSDYVSALKVTLLKLDAPEHAKSCMVGPTSCVSRPAGCKDAAVDLADWSVVPEHAEVPKGMWGDPVPAGQEPPPDPKAPTVTGTGGVVMRPVQPAVANCTPEMQIDEVFEDRIVNPDEAGGLSISADRRPVGARPVDADSFADIASIGSKDVAAARGTLYAALQLAGVAPGANEALGTLAGDPGASFADEPLEGSPMAVSA